jgi:4-amino-4-deoxy-L-arabinose transferase-like glycosyltransferase
MLRRLAGRARGLDRPGVVLTSLAALQAVVWMILLPPWLGPDEAPHFAYTQRLVETHSIPWFPGGDPKDASRPAPYSTELSTAMAWGGTLSLRLNLQDRPPGSPVSEELWRRADGRLSSGDRSDGGFTSSMSNPPLYYVYAAIPYAVTSSLSIFDRQFAMRAFNLPLLIAAVWLVWLIAGELLGPRGWPRVLATAAVALNPQLTQIAAVVDPDILLSVEWIAFLYLAIRAIRHGPSRGLLAGMAALCVASCLTHGRGLAILVPAAFVAGALVWRYRRPARNVVIVAGAAAALATVVLVYAALRYATGGHLDAHNVRQFASYLWQFYLPRLGFMTTAPGPDYGVEQVFIDRFFGTYGGLDVFFTSGALTLVKWCAIAAIVSALVGLFTLRDAVRRWWDVVALLAVTGVAYLLDMHFAGFRALSSGSNDPVLTGRYLLPLMPVYGLAVALAVIWVPRRAAPVVAGAVTGGLCLLSIAAIGFALARYYA